MAFAALGRQPYTAENAEFHGLHLCPTRLHQRDKGVDVLPLQPGRQLAGLSSLLCPFACACSYFSQFSAYAMYIRFWAYASIVLSGDCLRMAPALAPRKVSRVIIAKRTVGTHNHVHPHLCPHRRRQALCAVSPLGKRRSRHFRIANGVLFGPAVLRTGIEGENACMFFEKMQNSTGPRRYLTGAWANDKDGSKTRSALIHHCICFPAKGHPAHRIGKGDMKHRRRSRFCRCRHIPQHSARAAQACFGHGDRTASAHGKPTE